MKYFPVLRKHKATTFKMHSREQGSSIGIANISYHQNPLFLHKSPEFCNMLRQSQRTTLSFAMTTGNTICWLFFMNWSTTMWRSSRRTIENVRIFRRGMMSVLAKSRPMSVHTKTSVQFISLVQKKNMVNKSQSK